VLEAGWASQYPVTQNKQVLVFNTAAAFQAFYAIHRPGFEPPKADFTKQTVLAFLGGSRPSTGYWLEVPRIRWNYPQTSATAFVVEHKPTSFFVWVMTHPYAIVLVETKVRKVYPNWKVDSGLGN